MSLSNISKKTDLLSDESRKMVLSFLENYGVEVARRYIETCFNVPDPPRSLTEQEQFILSFVRSQPSTTDMICRHFRGSIKFSSVNRYLTNLKKYRLICLKYNSGLKTYCWNSGDADLSLVEYCEDAVMDFLHLNGSSTSKEIQMALSTSKRSTLTAIHSLEAAKLISVRRCGANLRCSLID